MENSKANEKRLVIEDLDADVAPCGLADPTAGIIVVIIYKIFK